MKHSKWIGIFGVILLIIAAYQPWIYIVSKDFTISGMHTKGTNFGRPALMNIYMAALATIFYLVPTIMAKRANIFVCAFGLAWALRNFIIISTCRAGECPEKQYGLYLYCAATVIMMVAAFSPDLKLKEPKEEVD